jgi:hypothetical protein
MGKAKKDVSNEQAIVGNARGAAPLRPLLAFPQTPCDLRLRLARHLPVC